MTYQKVVKSHQQKFSPRYVTKEWSLRSMITVIQFLAPKSHCLCPFKPQTVAEAAVVGLPGSKRRVGTLGSVRFWHQWRGTINIKQPYIRVSIMTLTLLNKSVKFATCLLKFLPQNSRILRFFELLHTFSRTLTLINEQTHYLQKLWHHNSFLYRDLVRIVLMCLGRKSLEEQCASRNGNTRCRQRR